MSSASIFEMFKIGVGPSSSHTLGPWRAANHFAHRIPAILDQYPDVRIKVHLFGSLALTGKGHGTDIAVIMGLSGYDPVTVPLEQIRLVPAVVAERRQLVLKQNRIMDFDPDEDIVFHWNRVLPEHANGMQLELLARDKSMIQQIYYSVGGGFILIEGEAESAYAKRKEKHVLDLGADILRVAHHTHKTISELVLENEKQNLSAEAVDSNIQQIWQVMKESIFNGCLHDGYLPGGLQVYRRAPTMFKKVCGAPHPQIDDWLGQLKERTFTFSEVNKLVSAFAIAVNEENASFSRVVTAPTNGSAGVIPAVLMYWVALVKRVENMEEIKRFLAVAAIIGSLFKNRATISAAMGGCQAEIGVSSAMAAGALTELMGGSPAQALMAAEIAMEHHLGLTCDPIGGLVQVPCIERNSMGAIKAITAANLALDSDPEKAKVSLDQIVETMWDTAKDMHDKYKETSLGGLAAKIKVSIPEC